MTVTAGGAGSFLLSGTGGAGLGGVELGGVELGGVELGGVDIDIDVDGVIGEVLTGRRSATVEAPWRIEEAGDARTLAAYRTLRKRVFCTEQGIFTGSDADDVDDDPRAVVLVARDRAGTVLGGVRLAPATGSGTGTDIGWWTGSRLAVEPGLRGSRGGDRAREVSSPRGGTSVLGGDGLTVGRALVRAACARAEAEGVLRFEAVVQARHERMFTGLGWIRLRDVTHRGRPHVAVRWPVDRVQRLAAATKLPLGALLAGLHLGGPGFVGDDGVPVPGSDVVAACDAIIPSLVERDPEWAGWCGVLANINDLSAMGAVPVGLLDAVAARDASFAARILHGVRAASQAYGVPVLGGHTQLGVPAALTVTALGRTSHPVRGGGGEVGHRVRLTADLGGGWRRGHTGRQWDSTTGRSPRELRAMLGFVAASRPAAAKDVSMAGVVGTLGMLAEAGGCGAVLDVADVPRPAGASAGDWLTCFPGFAMLTADASGAAVAPSGPAATALCGELVTGSGVHLRWPDGETTRAVDSGVTGLGAA